MNRFEKSANEAFEKHQQELVEQKKEQENLQLVERAIEQFVSYELPKLLREYVEAKKKINPSDFKEYVGPYVGGRGMEEELKHYKYRHFIGYPIGEKKGDYSYVTQWYVDDNLKFYWGGTTEPQESNAREYFNDIVPGNITGYTSIYGTIPNYNTITSLIMQSFRSVSSNEIIIILTEKFTEHLEKMMMEPNREMQKWAGSNKKEGCYIATSVYGSYHYPQVLVLRNYRDDYLSRRWYGRIFVGLYYFTSPHIVKFLGTSTIFRYISRRILDKLVAKLEKAGYGSTCKDLSLKHEQLEGVLNATIRIHYT